MITQQLNTAMELYFELTSRCRLECPKCARITDKGNFKVTDISLDLIKKGIDEFQPTSMIFSGNYGDPIYYPKMFDLLQYLQSINMPFFMETNGSGKSKDWWKQFKSYLKTGDVIAFSIDGLEDTNHLYRKNAKWTDITNGLEVLSNSTVLFWKFIIFKHNEHQILDAYRLAKSYGMKFILVGSNRFDDNDPLKPTITTEQARELLIQNGANLSKM